MREQFLPAYLADIGAVATIAFLTWVVTKIPIGLNPPKKELIKVMKKLVQEYSQLNIVVKNNFPLVAGDNIIKHNLGSMNVIVNVFEVDDNGKKYPIGTGVEIVGLDEVNINVSSSLIADIIIEKK